jgi:hypothetical protein
MNICRCLGRKEGLRQSLRKLRTLRANVGNASNFPEGSARQRPSRKHVVCCIASTIYESPRPIDIKSKTEPIGPGKTLVE